MKWWRLESVRNVNRIKERIEKEERVNFEWRKLFFNCVIVAKKIRKQWNIEENELRDEEKVNVNKK